MVTGASVCWGHAGRGLPESAPVTSGCVGQVTREGLGRAGLCPASCADTHLEGTGQQVCGGGGAVGSFGPRPFPGMQEKVLLS